MRGGYYNYDPGRLDLQSIYGGYWPRRLRTATNGNYLGFRSGVVHPQDSDYRGFGFTLRCLTRLTFLSACAIIRV